MGKPRTLKVDDVLYVRAEDAAPAVPGKRAVVVVDRGWIFAGDVTESNGRITLSRAVHVFRWESIGFDGMIADPKSSKVLLKKLSAPVDIPAGAEIFRIPVSDEWGL